MAMTGVLCLEGEWDSDLHKRTTVLPEIDLLERLSPTMVLQSDLARRPKVVMITADGPMKSQEWSPVEDYAAELAT